MPITVGARFGPYEVLSAVGAGGMGEVYKARDTRLDRLVALKVLREHHTNDPERRARFELEARLVSQLNHPHICTLYDVGHDHGIDYLVIEYLEGETLANRLSRGTPPFEQALQYAIQIADALAAAHRRGIVHRDLKPANVMLTKTGAKLLDFGIARLTATGVTPSDGVTAVTAGTLTMDGTLLGTPQYMAPEQLEGKKADARTDIFAFGELVYEMLTGRLAFEGKSQASLITAILEHEPPPVSTIQALTPPSLDRAVMRCLAKDPDVRWQTATDLLSELKWITESRPHAPTGSALTAAVQRPSGRAWTLAAVSTAAAFAVALLFFRTAPATDTQAIRFTIAPSQSVALSPVSGWLMPAVSPDGRRLAYIARRGGYAELWVRPFDALDAQPLAGTETASMPFWSADSRTLGFFSLATNTLKTIDAAGGPARSLAGVSGFAGGTWSTGRVIVFGSVAGGLYAVSDAGGSATPLTHPDAGRGESSHRWPVFLPDGRHLLYQAWPSNTIWLTSLDGAVSTRLFAADSQAAYVSSGHLLFVRQGALLAQPFDVKRTRLTGDAVPIVQQIVRDAGGAAAFAVSSGGVLAYRAGNLALRTQLSWVDRSGKTLASVGQQGYYRNPNLSPDETRVVVELTDPQYQTQDIWLMELARGVMSRLTFDPANDIYPLWSPDGNWIMFGSDRSGVFNLYRKHANGDGDDELVVKSSDRMTPMSWAPDGSVVYASGIMGQGVLPLIEDPKPRPLLQSPTFVQAYGQVSPDGLWFAYNSNESGRHEIYVRNFPTPAGKWKISQGGALFPRWRGDSRELFYYAVDGRLMAVPINAESGFNVGAAVPLFEARMFNGPNNATGIRQQYAVRRDGQRFLINTAMEETGTPPITIELNWTAGLQK